MYYRVNEEVKKALEENRPVVALESTIISHGMPYPQNVETALNVEKIIRDLGCVPATIGIIDGVGVVGMNASEIEEFGKRKGIVKASTRDLPFLLSQKCWGATTVATTMIFAALAGIEVFVTGGIGGVHRGAELTFDISRDLQELANTNVTVVCAGAKAILDLPKTMEYLETMGVPVLGYKSSELGAFYSRESGLKVDYEMNSALDIAKAIKVKRDLNLKGGVLISNPIKEEDSYPSEEINKVIDEAIKDSIKENIVGKESTPFLLKRIVEYTGGKSLETNIKLVYNNAYVGALIAKELCNLKEG